MKSRLHSEGCCSHGDAGNTGNEKVKWKGQKEGTCSAVSPFSGLMAWTADQAKVVTEARERRKEKNQAPNEPMTFIGDFPSLFRFRHLFGRQPTVINSQSVVVPFSWCKGISYVPLFRICSTTNSPTCWNTFPTLIHHAQSSLSRTIGSVFLFRAYPLRRSSHSLGVSQTGCFSSRLQCSSTGRATLPCSAV